MSKLVNPFNTLKQLKGKNYYYSLAALEEQKVAKVSSLPVSIRVILESLLRNCDGIKITEEDIMKLSRWSCEEKPQGDTPFVVSRVLLQDFTGVPLLVDLAAMRDAAKSVGCDPKIVEPLVPVDLIIDHSVQVDRAATDDAFDFNLKLEFQRNNERYAFLKWGQQAFETFKVFPPGMGICHQVNLEYLGEVVSSKERSDENLLFLDTLVGTDSHTTMINGLGIVGWGVGGIEGEAAMLGQPLSLEIPQVIGFCLKGKLKAGVTATDLTLTITQILRKENVVGKFIEFFGEGTAHLSVAERAMIANMAPEYGATMGYFPVDDKTLDYLKLTGRNQQHIEMVKEYLIAQGMFGIPKEGEITYTKTLTLDLFSVEPSVAGPKRPQDKITLSTLKNKFNELLVTGVDQGGYGKSKESTLKKVYVHSDGNFSLEKEHECGGKKEEILDGSRNESEMVSNRPSSEALVDPGYEHRGFSETVISDGSVVIAAITSCTNTSSPSVMIGAGLLAKKACQKGLKVSPLVKTSLAPGSRVVTDYLYKSGLQKYLDELGFQLVAYGCTTCIGNSGPLDERLEAAIKEHHLVACSVLSGNSNFEARIHGSVKANFLMSPPLVVAFAIAGRVNIDFEKEPLGFSSDGKGVYLKDIWPKEEEIEKMIKESISPSMFKTRYHIHDAIDNWKHIETSKGINYKWEERSTYIQNPPYLTHFSQEPKKPSELRGMRALAILGDSVTTDHISPAGNFKKESPAGRYLLSLGVEEGDFNSYGSRRGNHQVMMRGTFANVRIKNKMAEGREGGFTKHIPSSSILPIYDAAELYHKSKTPLIIFAGEDYGMGSSRDWAAKGSSLLGVRVVVAKSFERIHRSNLIGMGVLPMQFQPNDSVDSLKIKGDELFSFDHLPDELKPKDILTLTIDQAGVKKEVKLILRIDTPIEVEYYKHGGIMPYVLRQIIQTSSK